MNPFIVNYLYKNDISSGNLKVDINAIKSSEYSISSSDNNVLKLNFGSINLVYFNITENDINDEFSISELITSKKQYLIDNFINKIVRNYKNTELNDMIKNHRTILNTLTVNNDQENVIKTYNKILSDIKKYTNQSFVIE